MDPARAPDDPLRIEIRHPDALPGVTVGHFVSDGRLFSAVKDRLATVQNFAGNSEAWARGRVWRSGPGTLQLKLPGDVYRELRRDGPARFQVVLFHDDLAAQARDALDARFTGRMDMTLGSCTPAGAPLARLHALLLRRESEPLALQSSLAEALAALVRLTAGSPEPPPRRTWGAAVQRAIALIDERYTDPLTLDDLAAHARLDKFHLSRAFRDQVGLPPYAYVTHRRIARAQAFLAAGVPPSQVAAKVGLYDQSQLNRHFKRIVGLTPGEYANAAR